MPPKRHIKEEGAKMSKPAESKGPRLVPNEPFPPYAYVPGRFPHPTRDPAGHSFGVGPAACGPCDPGRWQQCRPYLLGLDWFNHGYYWEAHESWEAVWKACGRSGIAADFLKGLIKLAAAGVKAREGRPAGVRKHALRAGELFRQTALGPGSQEARYFGLPLERLIRLAAEVADDPARFVATGPAAVEIVFPFTLEPMTGC